MKSYNEGLAAPSCQSAVRWCTPGRVCRSLMTIWLRHVITFALMPRDDNAASIFWHFFGHFYSLMRYLDHHSNRRPPICSLSVIRQHGAFTGELAGTAYVPPRNLPAPTSAKHRRDAHHPRENAVAETLIFAGEQFVASFLRSRPLRSSCCSWLTISPYRSPSLVGPPVSPARLCTPPWNPRVLP